MTRTTEKTNYWKPREVAEYFRVSQSAVMGWIHQRKISSLLLPCKRYLIPAEEVERIKNSTYLPDALNNAEAVRARMEEREARKAAALARLNEYKRQLRKELKDERNARKERNKQAREKAVPTVRRTGTDRGKSGVR